MRFRRGWGWRRYTEYAYTALQYAEESRQYRIPPYIPLYRTPAGGRRLMRALEVGDPERVLFGLGPCGEIAYRMYREMKEKKG